jgi:peptide/nickel transport system ATP-binding protein
MLSVNNLSIEFSRYDKGWQRRTLHPVRDLSLHIAPGEIVAVVGSSGSGKSLLAHAVLGLLPGNARHTGDILFQGEPVTPRSVKRLRGTRIALIPQSVAYLNPLAKVGRQVYRASRLSGQCCMDAARNTDHAFARYRLESEVKAMYPFQVSGGMARRVLTATATAGDADLLIADEPTTGLDAEVIRQSLDHLRELADSGKGIMLITHDIDAAVTIADRVAVIYAGTTVETAPASDFTGRGRLRHPYTRALWNALPQQGFRYVTGNQPMEDCRVEGCIYADRCADCSEDCKSPQPLRAVGGGQVRCCHA